MDIFRYDFMRRAIIVAFFISIVLPMIGNVIVLKRLSNIGDTLSHASLAGAMIGAYFGVNHLFSALISCIVCVFLIEITRKFFSGYPEISTSIIMAIAVCISALVSGFLKNGSNINNFLFGSIIAITDSEVYLVIILALIVFISMIILYKPIFYIIFDEVVASTSGIRINIINFIFMLLSAICISISAKIIGAFIVSSILILPVASALQISNSYKNNLLLSILFAVISNISGLFLSYYFNLKPGGSIVLVALVIFFIVAVIKKISR